MNMRVRSERWGLVAAASLPDVLQKSLQRITKEKSLGAGTVRYLQEGGNACE